MSIQVGPTVGSQNAMPEVARRMTNFQPGISRDGFIDCDSLDSVISFKSCLIPEFYFVLKYREKITFSLWSLTHSTLSSFEINHFCPWTLKKTITFVPDKGFHRINLWFRPIRMTTHIGLWSPPWGEFNATNLTSNRRRTEENFTIKVLATTDFRAKFEPL